MKQVRALYCLLHNELCLFVISGCEIEIKTAHRLFFPLVLVSSWLAAVLDLYSCRQGVIGGCYYEPAVKTSCLYVKWKSTQVNL